MKIEFNQNELQIISAALVEMPYRVAQPLINNINKQIQQAHNETLDARDMPSGATKQPDPYTGD